MEDFMKPVATANLPILVVLSVLIICVPGFAGSKPESTDSTMAKEPKIEESLVIEWPEDGNWYLDQSYAPGPSTIQVYFPEGKGGDAWQEMATIETVYGKTGVNLPGMARMTFLGTQKGSPDATWEILEKGYLDETRKTAFIIYEIICPEFLSGEPPQIQYWKLIGGRTALFNVQYSYRGKDIPKEKKEVILEALKKAHLKIEEKSEETES